jgi:hypothetical protein
MGTTVVCVLAAVLILLAVRRMVRAFGRERFEQRADSEFCDYLARQGQVPGWRTGEKGGSSVHPLRDKQEAD